MHRRFFDLALVLQGVGQAEIGFGQWGMLPTCLSTAMFPAGWQPATGATPDGPPVLFDGPVALPQAEEQFAELEVRLGRRLSAMARS